MKKIKFILSFFMLLFLVLVISACSSNNQDLKPLQDALDEYDIRIADLEATIDSLKRNTTNANKRHDDSIEDLEKELQALQKQLEDTQSANGVGVKVFLADQYYLVVGDTFQLFYRSIIRAVNPYGYYIRLSGDDGHAYNRYYEFTPTRTGTFNLTIEVCDNGGNVYGKDSTKLIVASKTTSKSKTVLCIGDSLTSSGHWVARGANKFKAAGGKMTTVGTVDKTLYNVTVHYEGRAGWQWSSYISGFNDTPSPFVYNNKLDFKAYAENHNYGEITEFYIMMTFNGLPGVFKEFSFEDTFIKQAKEFIDTIHRDFPNAKISLMNLPLTSTNSGLGAYYTINLAYGDNYGKAVTVLHYGDFLEQWCKMDEYKSFMRYVDIKAQFDSEYNMPSESKKVNTTSSTTELVGNSMGLHPSVAGYEQIGDAFYRALMSNW